MRKASWGGRVFDSGEGGRYSPLARPAPPIPKKGLIDAPPQILRRLTRRWPGSKIRQKMKMRFLESARRRGSESHHFAMHFVKFFGHFQCSIKLSKAPDFIMTEWCYYESFFPTPPRFGGGSIDPPPGVENPTSPGCTPI